MGGDRQIWPLSYSKADPGLNPPRIPSTMCCHHGAVESDRHLGKKLDTLDVRCRFSPVASVRGIDPEVDARYGWDLALLEIGAERAEQIELGNNVLLWLCMR